MEREPWHDRDNWLGYDEKRSSIFKSEQKLRNLAQTMERELQEKLFW